MFFKIKKCWKSNRVFLFYFFLFLRKKNIFIFSDVICILKIGSKNQFSKIGFML